MLPPQPPYAPIDVEIYSAWSGNQYGQISGALNQLGDANRQWEACWQVGPSHLLTVGDSGSLVLVASGTHSGTVLGHFVGGSYWHRRPGFIHQYVQDLDRCVNHAPQTSRIGSISELQVMTVSITSAAQLAVERRDRSRLHMFQPPGQGAMPAAGPAPSDGQPAGDTGANVLARVVPTDIIVFYTAVIGVLEGIEKDNPYSYLPFRWSLFGATVFATLIAVTVASHLAQLKQGANSANGTDAARPQARVGPALTMPTTVPNGHQQQPPQPGQHQPPQPGQQQPPQPQSGQQQPPQPGQQQPPQPGQQQPPQPQPGQHPTPPPPAPAAPPLTPPATDHRSTGFKAWWQRWSPPAAETSAATFAFAIWGLVVPGSALYATLHSPVLPITVTTITAGGVLVMNTFFGQLLKKPAVTE
jgi:hypothetical protein